jgi:hypothetical protein
VEFPRFSQSKQRFLELFAQYAFPQTAHFVFLSKPLLPSPIGELLHEEKLDGKTMAFLWHSGAQAEQ